jgi:DNA ligase (NAD+)
MRNLVNYLNEHTKYYDEGHTIISDEEWDEKYYLLEKWEKEAGYCYPDSPTQRIIYEVKNELNKVTHVSPMLSLAKTKEIEIADKFCLKNMIIISAKMDGLSCRLTYQDGKLVRAETRGDGMIGEDVTHNARVVSNIPQTLPIIGTFIVDGEIICKYDAFTAYIEYKNPRNFASGSIRLLNSEECRTRHLSFIAWDLIEAEGLTFNKLNEKLSYLTDNYFEVVPFTTYEYFNEDLIQGLQNTASNYKLPIDGLVIKYNDCDYCDRYDKTHCHCPCDNCVEEDGKMSNYYNTGVSSSWTDLR